MIFNRTGTKFTPAAQQAIEDAAANLGVDVVYATMLNDDIFILTDSQSKYLFSIDVRTNVVFEQ